MKSDRKSLQIVQTGKTVFRESMRLQQAREQGLERQHPGQSWGAILHAPELHLRGLLVDTPSHLICWSKYVRIYTAAAP